MRQTIAALTILVLPVAAHSQEPPEIRAFDLTTISELGQEIYRVDKYAAYAADILFRQQLDLSDYRVRGWVVTEADRNPLVTFVGEYEDELRGLFEIRPESELPEQFKIVAGRELTWEERAKFAARETASAATLEYCSNSYNTVVLPDPTSDSWLVYLLAATDQPGLVLAGGHYRFTISSDGMSVQSVDRLSRSCLTIDKHGADVPEGATPVMMFMTHIVSDTPVETHVFLSLLHDMDFAIGTEGGVVWKVSGEQIGQIER